MIHEIVKGADDDIEFQGFKGRYFYRMIILVLGIIVITFFLYGIGFNSLYLFLVMLAIGLVGVMYIRHEMEVNKKFGHIHKEHSPPDAIIQNVQFFKMIKK